MDTTWSQNLVGEVAVKPRDQSFFAQLVTVGECFDDVFIVQFWPN